MIIDLDIEDLNLSSTQIKKLKRKERKNKSPYKQPAGTLSLKDIVPMTVNQQKAFDAFYDDQNLLLHGLPGTGKTFISIYLSLQKILSSKSFEKLVIVRSAVPSRELGHLPGTLAQKIDVYELPYCALFSELFGQGDAYDILKKKGVVEFMSTSFVRGLTIDNAIVIVDEMQNMAFNELHSTITRLGENSQIIFCGDIGQDDLTSERKREKTGIIEFMDILDNMAEFEFINFSEADIVRSGLVKSYILSCNELGY